MFFKKIKEELKKLQAQTNILRSKISQLESNQNKLIDIVIDQFIRKTLSETPPYPKGTLVRVKHSELKFNDRVFKVSSHRVELIRDEFYRDFTNYRDEVQRDSILEYLTDSTMSYTHNLYTYTLMDCENNDVIYMPNGQLEVYIKEKNK